MNIKKIMLLFVLLTASFAYSQLSEKSYKIKGSVTDCGCSDLLKIVDFSMLDLYRAEHVDNEIQVTRGETNFTIILLAASSLRETGVSFDEELVKKGAMMGTKPNQKTVFSFSIDENLGLKDLTTY